ncbi:cytidine deaminase [Devosia sp. Root413D1]|uniref:nucleoside deaminase n=1 Tax=unclassified Devosia TaxID=196773 RepID=UPI0006F98C9C|nr:MULTISPECIES: nucleoside deaminase [unclassified Devosia]KQU97571.1 cytidine deaminase [Devosia sp. Root105]KQW77468.1 cytidine deaminase [Devosia sp. Root413D1]
MHTPDLISRLLDVIELDLLPLTKRGVGGGNKLFGAAILRKSDLSLVVGETNNETENPLWHGEMHAIKRFYELPAAERPAPKDCLFLATHEPCSLCLSGITWSGFDNFYYLFSYEDTRDSFGIPHDIRILREVYAVPDPDRDFVPEDRPLYNRRNAFFESHDIQQMMAGIDRSSRELLVARVDELNAAYNDLSAAYQKDKGKKGIPLS